MDPFDFVSRENADYIERLYQQYLSNPRSLDAKWKAFFAGFEAGSAGVTPPGRPTVPTEPIIIGVYDLIHSYRELGHFIARLDPLGHDRPSHPLLNLSVFGLGSEDLDREVGSGSFLGPNDGTLRDLIAKLRQTYCRTLGVEYMDISDKAQREWLQQRMEPILNRPGYSPADHRGILLQLTAVEEFERYLHTRYIGQKRFSIEGGDALIPMINTIIEDGADLGVDEFIIGMAHRGRLNVLAHVLHKPYEVMLAEFEGTVARSEGEGDGDVKYHLGYSNDRVTARGRKVHLSLSPNPSHLELVDPVIEGIVRCKQAYLGDKERARVVPVLIHGEAAFTGQGVVAETLGLSELPGYRTGGTIHIIINNQIGFTATPKQTRFTPYPTDVAKMIQAPIFHVNGDDPEMAVHAARLAIAFRDQFKVDVFIDFWCYRRHGHNETDEPSFTQPVMYRQIDEHKTVLELYSRRLIEQEIIEPDELDRIRGDIRERLAAAAELARETRPRTRMTTLGGVWSGMTRAGADWSAQTAVPRQRLLHIADRATSIPEDFNVHPKLRRLLKSRLEMVQRGEGIDWGGGEMLAIGSLLLEGTPIRFTGQDVERGTFSHRHAVLHDHETGRTWTPLAHLAREQAPFAILNSMLSEMGVLGFEYGFSSADPRNLVIWEAQFGDFVNGAQPIIDQFISSAESKWQRMSGIVLLLPHGYEGQGPEHSNAYLGRFLLLCAQDNMQVCVPTTPAQYFHMLRRQVHRTFRKPLIAMTPKSLLRYSPSFSRIEEFADAGFQLVIDDPAEPPREQVRRILLCSGKIYYTLAAAREKEKSAAGTALVRVEQLYPFPRREIQSILAKYRHAEEIAWVQEEPKNRSGWLFMEPRLRELLPDNTVLSYHGRDEAASPATGSFKMHEIEERELVSQALEIVARATPAEEPAKAEEQTAVSK